MRIANAQEELGERAFCELDHLEHDDNYRARETEIQKDLRAKYDIPEGVHLFESSNLLPGLNKRAASKCKPFIDAFVRGKLTEETFQDLYFFLEECYECDYGWILIERPLGYFGEYSQSNADDVVREMRQIGTRSRSKRNNLPNIAGVFSSRTKCREVSEE